MKKLMNILMLSCKKSSELIEKKMYFGLGPIEKVQLFLHAGMCDTCKSWKKQSKDLDTALKKHIHDHPHTSDTANEHLSDDAKREIIRKMEEYK